jgi:flavin-binding protein dodecin
MTTHAKQEQGPAVVRVIEVVGVSTKGWDDAAQQVVARASRTLRQITGLDRIRRTAVVRDGQIVEYHVTAKVAFVVEKAIESTEGGKETTGPPGTHHPCDELGIWGELGDLE